MTTRSTLQDLQNRTQWTTIADLPIPLSGLAAVALDENRAIICGGFDDTYRSVDSVFIYDMTTMTTTPLPPMNQARFCHAAAIARNKMFVIGGNYVNGYLDTIKVLDLENLHDLENPPVWRVLDARLDAPRCLSAAVVVENEVYIIGGRISDLSGTSFLEVLDGEMENLSQGPQLTTARYGCAAALVGNSILVTGGCHAILGGNLTVQSTECLLVDKNAPQWQPLESNMESLSSSRISVAYGNCIVVLSYDGGVTAWEASSRTWTTLQATRRQHDRAYCAAVMLGADLVVFGGFDHTTNCSVASVECLFSPRGLFEHQCREIRSQQLIADAPNELWPLILARLGRKGWTSHIHYFLCEKNDTLIPRT